MVRVGLNTFRAVVAAWVATFGGVLVAGFLTVAPADAHGPSRKKVTETVVINAPVDKVWAVIGNFQDMNWHPAVEKTEGEGGNEPGATRKLTLKGGGELNEKLETYDAEKKSYKYRIPTMGLDPKVLPVNNYLSILWVEADGDNTKVSWKGMFYRSYLNNQPPPELNDEAAISSVTGIYKSGLAELKAKIEGGK